MDHIKFVLRYQYFWSIFGSSFFIYIIKIEYSDVKSWDVSGLEIDLVVKEKMIQSTDESGLKIWSCSCCGYVSKKTTNMYKHIERKHLFLTLKCDFCQKEFSSRNDFNVHVKTCHN